MFIGDNKILLNAATVSQIVEEYLNNRITWPSDHIKVVTVDASCNTPPTFTVKVKALKKAGK